MQKSYLVEVTIDCSHDKWVDDMETYLHGWYDNRSSVAIIGESETYEWRKRDEEE